MFAEKRRVTEKFKLKKCIIYDTSGCKGLKIITDFKAQRKYVYLIQKKEGKNETADEGYLRCCNI